MVKWEYLDVSIAQGANGDISLMGWSLEYLRHDNITVNGVLDDIGAQAWELVGFQGTNYVFKRPVLKD
jgi:hypothetical protein